MAFYQGQKSVPTAAWHSSFSIAALPSVLSSLPLTNDSPFGEPAFTLLSEQIVLQWVAVRLSFSAGALRVSTMSLHPLTRCEAFDPEEVELMGDVFEDILGSLHLPNRDDAVARLV